MTKGWMSEDRIGLPVPTRDPVISGAALANRSHTPTGIRVNRTIPPLDTVSGCFTELITLADGAILFARVKDT